MSKLKMADFDADKIRRFFEPGPVALVSSAHGADRDITPTGWYMMLGYDHVGCYLRDRNHSRGLSRRAGSA